MSKSYINFVAVKSAVTITQVLERYGLLSGMHSIKNGDAYEGRCPIHKGSSDSQFKVSVSKNCWNCFGSECKGGGNVLDFVAKMESVDVNQAAHQLNEWFNLGLDQQTASQRNHEPRPGSPGAHNHRNHGKDAPPQATASPFYSPNEEEHAEEPGANDPLKFELTNLNTDHPYIAERGLAPETASEFGLGYCAKGTMSGRIVIPIHNRDGALVGYAGRWPGKPPEERPKYKLPAGFKKSAEVFNLHRALKEESAMPLIVVEGFFDVMMLWQSGWTSAVSLMGSSLSATQEELLVSASDGKPGIILMLDEDEAGRTGRDKALCRLARRVFVRAAVLPREGAQPDHLTEDELSTLLG